MITKFFKAVLCAALCLSLTPLLAWAQDPADQGNSLRAESQDLSGNVSGGAASDSGDPADPANGNPEGSAGNSDTGESEGSDDAEASDPAGEGILEPAAPEDNNEGGPTEEEPGAALQGDSASALNEDAPVVTQEESAKPYSVTYRAHVANVGWQAWVKSGKSAGTTGQSRAIEALQLKLEGTGYSGSIEYAAHCANIGWQDFVKDGKSAGTTGQSRQTEAVRIILTGEISEHYDVRYRVHAQNKGWLAWACNGDDAGTQGYGWRMEALQIELVPAGTAKTESGAFAKKPMNIAVSAHSANFGWMGSVEGGQTAGTTGRSLRLEAVRISVSNPSCSGSITYRAHVANVGWQNWVKEGALAGTTGRGLQMEAIEIKLTGELAEQYDIYYRVHSSNIGWLGWAMNGETAGVTGYSCRAEAIQVKLVKKGNKAPEPTAGHTVDLAYSSQAYVSNKSWLSQGSGRRVVGTTGKSLRLEAFKLDTVSSVSGAIEYSICVGGTWQDWKKAGATAGSTTGGKRIEAVRIRLTGDLSKYFTVHYRTHSSNYGWQGWTSDGAKAGTTKCGLGIEAFELAIVAKGGAAPGSTSNSYREYTSGDPWLDSKLAGIAASYGYDLRACFDYVARYPYVTMSTMPTGNWAPPFAKQMLQNGGGNCYRYAALFCMLAREMGYDAKAVSGWIPTNSGGQSVHGWCEIRIDGTIYVCDPDMVYPYPGYNWYMRTYANAPVVYHKW